MTPPLLLAALLCLTVLSLGAMVLAERRAGRAERAKDRLDAQQVRTLTERIDAAEHRVHERVSQEAKKAADRLDGVDARAVRWDELGRQAANLLARQSKR